jgi:hypothetical protein
MPRKEFPEEAENTLESTGIHPRTMLQIQELKVEGASKVEEIKKEEPEIQPI